VYCCVVEVTMHTHQGRLVCWTLARAHNWQMTLVPCNHLRAHCFEGNHVIIVRPGNRLDQ